MISTTSYTTLSLDELLIQYEGLAHTLAHMYRELASYQTAYNRDYITAYARSPGNSVSAKEREAEFNCIELKNDIMATEYEVKALESVLLMVKDLVAIRGGTGGFTPRA